MSQLKNMICWFFNLQSVKYLGIYQFIEDNNESRYQTSIYINSS